MSDLSPRDRELVALGAAMGSNCVPCVEYHIPESRKVGLTEPEIHAAIQIADKLRQVPARNTLQAALRLLPSAAEDVRPAGTDEGCGAAAPAEAAKPETSQTAQCRDMMRGMMTKMMDTYGGHGQPAGAAKFAEKMPAANPGTSDGCGCG